MLFCKGGPRHRAPIPVRHASVVPSRSEGAILLRFCGLAVWRGQIHTRPNAPRHLMSTLLRWLSAALKLLFRGIYLLFQILVITWTTLAIYYSNLPWPALRLALAAAFALF